MSRVESGSAPVAIRLSDIHKSFGPVHANRGASIVVTLPPLGAIFLKRV